jgi:hypothetical protein
VSVRAVRVNPVSRLVAVTFAPETTAPLVSCTVPTIDAVACPRAGVAKKQKIKNATIALEEQTTVILRRTPHTLANDVLPHTPFIMLSCLKIRRRLPRNAPFELIRVRGFARDLSELIVR